MLASIVLVVIPIQLAIGSDIVVLGLSTATILIGCYSIYRHGLNTYGSFSIIWFVTNYIIVSAITKTVLLQPLDSNLYAPVFSFFAVFMTVVQMYLAFTISKFIHIRGMFSRPCLSGHYLLYIGFMSFFIASASWLLNQIFSTEVAAASGVGHGLGGFAILRDFAFMNVISLTAYNIMRSNGRYSLSFPSIAMIFLLSIMFFLDNKNIMILLIILSYVLTCIYFNYKWKLRHIGILIFLLVMTGVFIMPVAQLYRNMGIRTLSFSSKVSLVYDVISKTSVSDLISHADNSTTSAYASGYYDYYGNNRFQQVIGRFSSIQQVDPILASDKLLSNNAWSMLYHNLMILIPRVLYEGNKAKDDDSPEYKIVTNLGLASSSTGQYPTIPLLSEAYIYFGLIGLLIIPFVFYLSLFSIQRLIAWDLEMNVFSIFFLIISLNYIYTGNVGQVIGYILRTIPTFIALFWIINLIYKRLFIVQHKKKLIKQRAI